MTRRVGIQRIAGRNPNRIGYPEKDIRSLGRKYRLRGGKLRAETKSFWPFVFGHHHFNYLKARVSILAAIGFLYRLSVCHR
jgi:hypothetical protein